MKHACVHPWARTQGRAPSRTHLVLEELPTHEALHQARLPAAHLAQQDELGLLYLLNHGVVCALHANPRSKGVSLPHARQVEAGFPWGTEIRHRGLSFAAQSMRKIIFSLSSLRLWRGPRCARARPGPLTHLLN